MAAIDASSPFILESSRIRLVPGRCCQNRKRCGRYQSLADVRKARKGAEYERHFIMADNGPFSYCLRLVSQMDQFGLSIGWGTLVEYWSDEIGT